MKWALVVGRAAGVALALMYALLMAQRHGVIVAVASAAPASGQATRAVCVSVVNLRPNSVQYWVGSTCGCATVDGRVHTVAPFSRAEIAAEMAVSAELRSRPQGLLEVNFHSGSAFWTEHVRLGNRLPAL